MDGAPGTSETSDRDQSIAASQDEPHAEIAVEDAADSAEAGSGRSGAAHAATGKSGKTALGVVLIVAGLGLVLGAWRGVLSALDATGLVDEVIEQWRLVGAFAGAALTALGAKGILGAWANRIPPPWQWVLASAVFLTVLAPALWFLLVRPDQEYVEGEISEDQPFAKRTLLTGTNGSRYFITLDTSPELSATFSIRGAGREIFGVADRGRVVADSVLAGNVTWTVVIKSLKGDGKYMLYVDSVEPHELEISDKAVEHSFDPLLSRASFIFQVGDGSASTAEVFVRVRAVTEDEADPGWTLRSSSGTTIAHKLIEDETKPFTVNQETHAEVPSGTYVLDVFGAVGQRFELTVNDGVPGTPRPTSTPMPTPTPDPGPGPVPQPDLVAVPVEAQYRAPGTAVVSALVGAGFVVQTVPVCSNSFAADDLPVGATRQVVKSGAATISDEVEIIGASGLNTANLAEGNALPRGSRLDVKTFSGLPCN